jgi:hypothetical protein
MIARLALRNTLHNNTQSCRRLALRRRRSQLQSFCIHHRVLKPMTASRIPLTPKTNVRPVLPAAKSPVAAIQQIRLPRVLPRPSRSEVDAANVVAASPELQNVTPQYIREKLLPLAPQYVFFSFTSRFHCLTYFIFF